MFENFTDQARRVVVLAQEEARVLGHDSIGPEHLLIALTRDDTIAAKALADLGADASAVAGTVLAVSDRESSPRSGTIPFTPVSRKVMTAAQQVAARLGSNNVQPVHLLFGVSIIEDTVTGYVLQILGITAEQIQEALGKLLVTSGGYVPKTEREAAGHRFFTVYADADGTILPNHADHLTSARFALHPGELLSIRDGGTIDESVRFLDYPAVRAIADERGADVVILTSRQSEITAVDAGGELVKVGEATIWSPVEIAERLVPLGG
jgi:ATP-dependent Clp protease ATP-binding subunit ClpC